MGNRAEHAHGDGQPWEECDAGFGVGEVAVAGDGEILVGIPFQRGGGDGVGDSGGCSYYGKSPEPQHGGCGYEG